MEEKVQTTLDEYSRRLESTKLQMDMFKDNVNALSAEAQKHVKWVESQHEKNAARQDLFGSGLQEMMLKLPSNIARQDALESSLGEMKLKLSNSTMKQEAFESGLQKIRQLLSSSTANQDIFENALQDMRLKVASSSNQVIELDSVLTQFFKVHNKMRSMAASTPHGDAASSQGDLQDELHKMWSPLSPEDGRHSEPATRATTSRPHGDSARYSEPAPHRAPRLSGTQQQFPAPSALQSTDQRFALTLGSLKQAKDDVGTSGRRSVSGLAQVESIAER